ncbi:hypothetical protein [Lysobacter tyrosinilyticus]
MLRHCLIILLSVVLVACATNTHRPRLDYQALSAQPTPPDWAAGAVWRFDTASGSGKLESHTFRVSDERADTCVSGDWRKLERVDGHLGSAAQAAYTVSGRFLLISLNSNLCDANDEIRGELAGVNFNGERSAGGVTGGAVIGTVQGRRVH